MNEIIYPKLQKFLDEKFLELLKAAMRFDYFIFTPAKNYLNLSYIKEEKGFDNEIITYKYSLEERYKFTNGKGCQCILYFKGKTQQISIQICIDDFCSREHMGTIKALYRCLDELDRIAGEFRQLRSDLTKQEKINKISKDSITTWIKKIMQDQGYSYFTTESENKITLSIKVKNRMQLWHSGHRCLRAIKCLHTSNQAGVTVFNIWVRKTLWICSDEATYESHKNWMEKHGRCCWIKK